jgi:hypothetical protein
MVRDSRRFCDESCQESLDDASVYGYGTGPDTSMSNVEFNGDYRQGDVCRDEEETCVDDHPPLPNIRLLVPQCNMSYTGSVLRPHVVRQLKDRTRSLRFNFRVTTSIRQCLQHDHFAT